MTICVTAAVVIFITVAGGMSIASGSHGGAGTVKTGAAYLSSGRFWIISMFLVGILAAGTMVAYRE